MAVVTSFTEDQNFWESNPQLLLDKTFKEFRKADKSRGKQDSSNVMWWVAFCYDLDPANKYRGLPLEDKHSILGEELLKDAQYYEKHASKLDPLIERYMQLMDSPAKRALREWEQKMTERAAFIRDTKYTMGEINDKGAWVGGTATVLDTMMKNTKSLYDAYQEVLKQLAEEDSDEMVKGGATASLSDEGEI